MNMDPHFNGSCSVPLMELLQQSWPLPDFVALHFLATLTIPSSNQNKLTKKGISFFYAVHLEDEAAQKIIEEEARKQTSNKNK